MLERIEELAKNKVDFAIETTLSTLSYAALFKKLRKQGYEIFLVFVCIQSESEAVKRVKQRVQNGGHHIPEEVILRRFERGRKNLVNIYLKLSSNWLVIDNSSENTIFVAEKKAEQFIIHDKNIWNQLHSHE